MLTRLAVYDEVCMVNQLTSLTAGVSKAHAENYVVQTALELLQQDLTGDALLALSLLVVSMELLLEYAVDEFYLCFSFSCMPYSDCLRRLCLG